MSKFSGAGRWPDLIKGCVKCSVSKYSSSYGRRGLCVRCNHTETLAERIHSWPIIRRDKQNYIDAASKYTKDNYWRRKKVEVIYQIVSQIGATEASERLEVSKKDIKNWMNGVVIPSEFSERVKKLRDEIYDLTVKAKSECREEEFFNHHPPEVRIFEGKCI